MMQIIHQFLRDFKERNFKVCRNNVRILLKEITPDTFQYPITPDTSGRDGTRSFWFPIRTRCLLSLSPVDWRSTNPSQTRMTVSERLSSRIMTGMCCVLGNRSKWGGMKMVNSTLTHHIRLMYSSCFPIQYQTKVPSSSRAKIRYCLLIRADQSPPTFFK